MPIKVIDSFEPASDFNVVKAEHVGVNNEKLSDVLSKIELDIDTLDAEKIDFDGTAWDNSPANVKQALETLYQTLTGKPTLELAEGEETSKSVDLNQKITIKVLTTSQVSNNVTIITEKKQRDGSWVVIKRLSTTTGVTEIDLGVASTIEIAEYRVSASDIRGTSATIPGAEGQYIYLTRKIGGVQLSTNFSSIVSSKTFVTDWNSVTLQYKLDYPEGENPTIKISCPEASLRLSAGETEFRDEIIVPVNRGTYNLSVDFKFETAKSYEIIFQATVETLDGIDSSSELTYQVRALTANSIFLNMQEILPASPSTKDNIRFVFNISHSTSVIGTSTPLKVTCTLTNGETSLTKQLNNVNVNKTITWAIGSLPFEGNWTYNIIADLQTGSSGITLVGHSASFEIKQYNQSVSIDGLVAHLKAEDYDGSNIWVNSYNPAKYNIKFSNLSNNDFNGKLTEGEDTFIRLTKNTFGLVYLNDETLYKPYGTDVSTGVTSQDYTIEFCYRSTCVGDYSAVALSSGGSNNKPGFYASFKDIQAYVQGTIAKLAGAEDQWIHICFVFQHNIVENPEEIADINPAAALKIYINGTLSKYVPLPSWEGNHNIYSECYPLCLNGETADGLAISKTGLTDIKFLRIYERALSTDEIINNFIYDAPASQQEAIINRNNSSETTIPVVYMVNISNDKTFETLHSITKKKPTSENDSDPVSKTYYVPCKLYYCIGNDYKTFDNVAVYLQGTSSLLYPVKNYQFKFYTDAEFKSKDKSMIPPKGLEGTGDTATVTDIPWITPSYVYTLKCDYMDQSHKNNTPTAKYYDHVLEEVIGDDNTKYSLAKRVGADEQGNYYYRDSIDGFPVIVYYCENENKDAVTLDEVKNNSVYAGTYMWNVDKEGDQLGFKISADVNNSNIDATWFKNDIPSDYVTEESFKLWKYAGSVNGSDFNGSSREVVMEEGSPLVTDKVPCVSYEGASNVNISAGTFYTLEEYNKYVSENRIKNPDYDESKKDDPDYDVPEYLGPFTKWSDYIEATLEPRFNYAEDYEDADYFNDLTYGHMRRAIEWVSECYKLVTSGNKKEKEQGVKKFNDEFSNYFSYDYCLAYYLQMMFFTQVDNAGKNAMFDVWYDGVLYPRPYDMDTQMGETNTGEDKIIPSAELPGLSPVNYSGSITSSTRGGADDDNNHQRFKEFNVSGNRLWTLFGTVFAEQVVTKYTDLRASLYTVDETVDFVNSVTSDVFGELFYNRDAASKYLRIKDKNGRFDNQHLEKLQGSRSIRYKDFLKKRIVFLDSYFNYQQGDSLNGKITCRSDANGEGINSVQLGFSVYSPQYIRANIGSGEATATFYVDENSTFQLSGTQEGVLLTIPTAGNNKEMEFRGAGNIKNLQNLQHLYLSEIQVGEAEKLLDFDLSDSPRLATLSLGNNTYLTNFNVSNSKLLSGVVDLSGCSNLETINIEGTKITSLSLPQNGILTSINCSKSEIAKLELKNQPFLRWENINLTDCNYVEELIIDNCSMITELDLTPLISSLRKITIENCNNLTTLIVDNMDLTELTLASCPALKTISAKNGKGSAYASLDLTSLTNLESLDITTLNAADPEGKGARLALPTSLKKFAANNSNLYALKSSAENYTTNTMLDFSGFEFEENQLVLWENTSVEYVSNLTYSGNLFKLFYKCSKLKELNNLTLTATSTNGNPITIGYMMFQCGSLTKFNVDMLTNPEDVIIAEYVFQSTDNLSLMTYAQPFISKLVNVTNLLNCLVNCGRKLTETFELTSDFFKNNDKIENLYATFYGTRVTKIHPGVFDNLQNLKIVRELFIHCSTLESAPSTLFAKVKEEGGVTKDFFSNLTNLNGLFYDCVNLAKDSSKDDQPFTEFYIPKNITSVVSMYHYCQSLTQFNIKKTLARRTALTDTRGMFYGCINLTTLLDDDENNPLEDLFKDNTALTKTNAMFAECTKLTCELPKSLAITNELPHLVETCGMFYNCSKLYGVIDKTFFSKMPNLEKIGYDYTIGNSKTSPSYTGLIIGYSVGGMFANTSITAFHVDFLNPLTKLTDCSFLFFSGRGGGFSSLYGAGNFEYVVNDSGKLKGFFAEDSYEEDKIKKGIPASLFKVNANLENVSYMFAGNPELTNVWTYDSEKQEWEEI